PPRAGPTGPSPRRSPRQISPPLWSKRVNKRLVIKYCDGRIWAGSRKGTVRRSRINLLYPMRGISSDQHFARRALAEELHRAGGCTIGARAEHRDDIARLSPRKTALFGQSVERRAQTADNAGLLLHRRIEPGGDRHGIIAPHDRSEIARGGELVVHAAINDEEHLAMADFPVDHRGEVNPRFANQIATEFKAKIGVRQFYGKIVHALRQGCADGCEIEGRVAWEIGNAEAAAEVQVRQRQAGFLRQSRRQGESLGLSFNDSV